MTMLGNNLGVLHGSGGKTLLPLEIQACFLILAGCLTQLQWVALLLLQRCDDYLCLYPTLQEHNTLKRTRLQTSSHQPLSWLLNVSRKGTWQQLVLWQLLQYISRGGC